MIEVTKDQLDDARRGGSDNSRVVEYLDEAAHNWVLHYFPDIYDEYANARDHDWDDDCALEQLVESYKDGFYGTDYYEQQRGLRCEELERLETVLPELDSLEHSTEASRCAIIRAIREAVGTLMALDNFSDWKIARDAASPVAILP